MTLVLVVEDQPQMRQLLHEWLEADGAMVAEAATAEEGLTLATSGEPPAVALVDLRLPGRSGLWLADQLRTASPHTGVVVITGVHDFDVAVKSLQNGVVDYVAKPFSRARLQQALQRALAAHSERRAVAALRGELQTDRARVAEALVELEANAASSIEALLTILEAREPGARARAHRIATIAVNLALALEIREPELTHIEQAALLHDIGKLAVPDYGGASSPAELLQGPFLLKHVRFLAPAGEIVASVQERYDGSGLPYGLRGEAIPRGSRILAVAIAFDELVNGPGKVAPTDAAVMLLGRRSHFDPRVLEALCLLYTAGGARPGASTVRASEPRQGERLLSAGI
jgi:putative two-component system response regulator